MKHILSTFLLLGLFCTAQATPKNLYEQLCEVNQEWYKNHAIAEKLGFLNAPLITNEQDLLVFHIQTLERIFLARVPALPTLQWQARAEHLKVLNAYWQRRDCPQNYYLPFRNPVFIDHEGRYCAVAYLMKASGKQAFCEAVQKNSNFIFVRQIESPEFMAWQQASGLSVDELAWIQPGYMPTVYFTEWDKRDAKGNIIELDSVGCMAVYYYTADHTDMFHFSRIFMGDREDPAVSFKKLKPAYQGKPDWSKLNDAVTAMTVYQNELYVATDSANYTDTQRASIMRWNKQNATWDMVLKLDNRARVYCFFESKGRLHAGGKIETIAVYDQDGNTQKEGFTKSFITSSVKGKDWKTSNEDYGGAVFGLIYKNKKRYLGIVETSPNNDGSYQYIKQRTKVAREAASQGK